VRTIFFFWKTALLHRYIRLPQKIRMLSIPLFLGEQTVSHTSKQFVTVESSNRLRGRTILFLELVDLPSLMRNGELNRIEAENSIDISPETTENQLIILIFRQ